MAAATLARAAPVHAGENERSAIANVDRFLAGQQNQLAKLTGPDGQEIPLSESLYEVLRQAAHVLAQEEAVAIVPVHKLLTTNEAADMLNISRPSLIQILVCGDMPHTMVGTHRRIRFGDLMSYMGERDARRRAALDSLVELSDELGLYERT